MNDLIKINDDDGKKTVNARDLHKFLESKKDFSTWIKRKIDRGKFFENTDFIKFTQMGESNSKGLIEYHVSIDMAKHISMMENTNRGFEVRDYFIECEKELKNMLPQTYKEALIALVSEVEDKEKLQIELNEAQPKIEFHDQIEESKDSISVVEFANILSKKGFEIGQNRLFKFFYENKYLIDNKRPYQKYLDDKLFEVNEYPYKTLNGDDKIGIRTYITGKGQIYFTKKARENFIKNPVQTSF